MNGGRVELTAEERQALGFASRALREVGASLLRDGAPELAAESYVSAAQLDGVARRATVHPMPDQQAER